MAKVGQYRLMRAEGGDHFEVIVNDAISEGWTLHGPTFSNRYWPYMQAMTHTSKPKKKQEDKKS